MKKIIVGALAVATLAFGGVAYAQQQEAPGQNQQAPQQSRQESNPGGGGGYDCPEKEGGGQRGPDGSQETEV